MFWCLPKTISNRRYSNIWFLILQFSSILYAKCGVLMLSKGISNRRYSTDFNCIIPARPWKCRCATSMCKTWYFDAFPKTFQTFRNIKPAHPWKPRFSNFMCKIKCIHAFPKAFQIEDIQICFSCPPLPVQIRQFCAQDLVFSRLDKIISNRKYSNILFLPTPASLDSASLGVLGPSQRHFK